MHLGWRKNKRDVYIMSSSTADDISRKRKVEQVLEIIETYNSKIGGIDKNNQMLPSYKQIREKKT